MGKNRDDDSSENIKKDNINISVSTQQRERKNNEDV